MRDGFRSVLLRAEPTRHLKLTHKLAAHEKEMIGGCPLRKKERRAGVRTVRSSSKAGD